MARIFSGTKDEGFFSVSGLMTLEEARTLAAFMLEINPPGFIVDVRPA